MRAAPTHLVEARPHRPARQPLHLRPRLDQQAALEGEAGGKHVLEEGGARLAGALAEPTSPRAIVPPPAAPQTQLPSQALAARTANHRRPLASSRGCTYTSPSELQGFPSKLQPTCGMRTGMRLPSRSQAKSPG